MQLRSLQTPSLIYRNGEWSNDRYLRARIKLAAGKAIVTSKCNSFLLTVCKAESEATEETRFVLLKKFSEVTNPKAKYPLILLKSKKKKKKCLSKSSNKTLL